jgi:S1-C subfamily serine protease
VLLRDHANVARRVPLAKESASARPGAADKPVGTQEGNMHAAKYLTPASLAMAVLFVALAATGAAAAPAAAPATPAAAAPATSTASTAATSVIPTAVPAAPAAVATDPAKAVEAAIERTADRISPAVVNILVTREVSADTLTEEDLGLDDPPSDLKEFLDRLKSRPRPRVRTQGNGSGCIITADGFILTSEHVIRDAVDIRVTLSSRKRYSAKVVGADPRRDLAVIRIEAKDLPVAALGDASTLRRGQFVLALGSPFGFGRDGQASLSFGIVSGTRRAITGVGRMIDRYYGNLIQTDTAINPGNSGGPLVNLDGEVVGVNAVISSQSGSSEGVGFAVPITAETRHIIDRLKKGEEIVYGYLGVEIREISEDDHGTGVESGSGAFVAEVLPGTPGAKAGLRVGDVITMVGDSPVRDPDDVIQVVQSTPVGEKISLTVQRRGKTEHFSDEEF